MNNKFYRNDKERWNEIDKIRRHAAEHLRIPHGSLVLDVLVGEGDFARTVAKSSRDARVIGGEILASDLDEAKRRIERDKLRERVVLLRMDVTRMAFVDSCFDYVVNFLGWEDFVAISGEALVSDAFGEMVRVLKPNGVLAITFTPSLDAHDWITRKDNELQEYMYKSAKKPRFFPAEFFVQMFENHGIKLVDRNVFEAPKSRLRPRDAERFLEWFFRNYRSFYASDVEMRTYEEVLSEFGEFIEKHGVRERKSSCILFVGKKQRTVDRLNVPEKTYVLLC